MVFGRTTLEIKDPIKALSPISVMLSGILID